VAGRICMWLCTSGIKSYGWMVGVVVREHYSYTKSSSTNQFSNSASALMTAVEKILQRQFDGFEDKVSHLLAVLPDKIMATRERYMMTCD